MDMEVILTFQCNSEMMVTMCHLTAATVWHREPIVLCIEHLSTMQVRDYVATRSSYPSGASMQPWMREWKSSLPSANPVQTMGSR